MNKTFYNLHELVSIPLSDKFQEENKWQKVSYQAKGVNGTGLVAGHCVEPEEIELDLNAKGWHKIYIALGTLGGVSSVEVSLSNEDGKTIIAPTNIDVVEGVGRWIGYDYAEESFFKAADLTGQKIKFGKPLTHSTPISSVIWYIRLEEMSDSEVLNYKGFGLNKNIMWHYDGDYLLESNYKKPEDYLGRIKMLENGNGDILIQECFIDGHNANKINKVRWLNDGKRLSGVNKYIEKQWEIKNIFANETHELGMDIYAGYRLEMANFKMPLNQFLAYNEFFDKNSHLRCMTRDGQPISALSYAYSEVRKFSIDLILKTLPDNWDGISLFFHRGVLISLEEPVIQEVYRRYGVDARRLPRSDQRLYSVLCDFILEFIKDLKYALEVKAKKLNRKKYKINVVVFYDPNSTKYFGCDIERLLQEKLIDSFSQGLMEHYEDVNDCLADDGLIDLEKYKKKKQTKHVIKRHYDDDFEHILFGAKEFLSIKERYGGEFYATLGWDAKSYIYQAALAKELYLIGADKLIVWNGNHVAKRCTTLQGVKQCGDKNLVLKDKIKVYYDSFRLTQINELDISEFDTNWRG